MRTSLCKYNHVQESAYTQVTIGQDGKRVETYNADR